MTTDPVLYARADGRHTYRSGLAPAHLGTRRQLRAEGLSAAGLAPAGWLHYSPWHDTCPLYDRRLARPVRPLTTRQRETLARGRGLANTAECHRCRQARVRWYRSWGDDGAKPLCQPCLTAVRAERRKAQLLRQHEEAEAFERMLVDDREAAARWAGDVLADPMTVVLDTETTGLDGWIVELAIVAADGTTLLDTLVHPQTHIPEDATRIHGIDDEAVSGAPTFADLLPRLEDILAGKRIVIYNASFDTEVLAAELRRAWYGEATSWEIELELERRRRDWAGGALATAECAMRQHARWHGDWSDCRRSYTWQPLCGGHRAAGDCRAVLDRLALMAGGQRPLFLAR